MSSKVAHVARRVKSASFRRLLLALLLALDAEKHLCMCVEDNKLVQGVGEYCLGVPALGLGTAIDAGGSLLAEDDVGKVGGSIVEDVDGFVAPGGRMESDARSMLAANAAGASSGTTERATFQAFTSSFPTC